ncbi:hypothetical protein GCM10010493_60140 [Streptomyces lavendulae subsp. grasserius]
MLVAVELGSVLDLFLPGHGRVADGRIAAEMPTPYPPGIPATLPGERLTKDVLRYLRTGVEAGMVVPDAVDTQVTTVRVLRED